LPAPEVNICGREVVDALVLSLMIVMIDKCLDLRFKVCWEEVVIQQDAVLQIGPVSIKWRVAYVKV
jgi:hypothetical protein